MAIGCTGGRHRSVMLAEDAAKPATQGICRESGYRVRHRDIEADVAARAPSQVPGSASSRGSRPRFSEARHGSMIGVVVVTHGQLATELVNAAETIVGDLPQFAAVSIGWHDDVELARDGDCARRSRAWTRGRACIVLDGHVRRDAVEPRDHVARGRPGRGRHRRQPADAHQARRHPRGGRPARARPPHPRGRAHGRSGWHRICSAWTRRRVHDERRRHGDERTRHARACGGPVRPRGDGLPVAGARRPRRPQTWTARASWASCCWRPPRGTSLTITADGPDEADALDALCALVESGLGEEPCSA